ncbi:MAG TPA: J domain-containing protein, partial [Terricaulis sp.]|nr:J domain-containing protein [Terricaulis sp.]
RRALIAQRWPAFLLASAAIFTLMRGGFWLALALFVISGLAFMLGAPRQEIPPDEGADAEARSILGVGPDASAQEIRAAYRAKMVHAHPDRGGSHNEAARLTAARDRLLKRRR